MTLNIKIPSSWKALARIDERLKEGLVVSSALVTAPSFEVNQLVLPVVYHDIAQTDLRSSRYHW